LVRLGVNIDHVATVRQARKVWYPDPVEAARLALAGGADAITIHLREDRRHIQDRDVERLRSELSCSLNLEMAAVPEIIAKAREVRPDDACLVPERREEVTTEGGLDVVGAFDVVRDTIFSLKEAGILVSLFVDPVAEQIEAAKRAGADAIELHTGAYAESRSADAAARELEVLKRAAELGQRLGLRVNAGHGLRYDNVLAVGRIDGVHTLNIGHSIVARAVLVGMERAVREMRELIP